MYRLTGLNRLEEIAINFIYSSGEEFDSTVYLLYSHGQLQLLQVAEYHLTSSFLFCRRVNQNHLAAGLTEN